MLSNREPSRRGFLAGTAVALTSLGTPLRGMRKPGPNDRIRVGVIGVGGRAGLLINQLPMEAEVVALADCNFVRCREVIAKKQTSWQIFPDYRKLLENKDIDGVIIATTDHGRVLPCIAACQAGKDIYAEKPLTLYVAEGRTLVKAARKYKRIVQVGSQQRSMETNRVAADFVREGGLGKLTMVNGVNYPSSEKYVFTTEEPVPNELNWDMWLGQAAMRPYNQKLHKAWMACYDFSGGEMTNWGAHGLDQIQAALGTSLTGPTEWWPLEDGPKGSIGFRYANGVTVHLDQPAGPLNAGAIFKGEKGTMEIMRNKFTTNPEGMVTNMPRKEDVDKWRDEVALWQAKYHLQNWLDCMRSRKEPRADVEIGQRSITVSHLANITRALGRKLEWDPKAEKFKNDAEANALLTRPRRAGYELPEKV